MEWHSSHAVHGPVQWEPLRVDALQWEKSGELQEGSARPSAHSVRNMSVTFTHRCEVQVVAACLHCGGRGTPSVSGSRCTCTSCSGGYGALYRYMTCDQSSLTRANGSCYDVGPNEKHTRTHSIHFRQKA